MAFHYLLSDHTDNNFDFYISNDTLSGNFPQHSHDFIEILIVLQGNAVHVIGKQEFMIRAGDIFVLKLNDSHAFKNSRDFEVYNIMFSPGFLNNLPLNITSLPGYKCLFILEPYYRKQHQFESRLSLTKDDMQSIIPILQEIKREYSGNEPAYSEMIEFYLKQLLIHLSRLYPKTMKMNEKSFHVMRIADSLTYIEKHYKNEISLTALAEKSHLSVRQFIRIFKEHYQETPMQYIIKRRIKESQSLLINKTDLTITEIAYNCGFNDSNYFSRIFKQLTNMTPKQYRKYNT